MTNARLAVLFLALAAVPLDLIVGRSRGGWGGTANPGEVRIAGALLAAALLAFLAPGGIVDRLRRRAAKARAAGRGGDRWWLDAAWNEREVESRIAPGVRCLVPILTVAYAGAACVVGNHYLVRGVAMATRTQAPPDPGIARIGLGAALLLLGYAVWPWFAYGRLVVAWPRFPQYAGDRLEFHVGTSPGGAQIDRPHVALRCVRESATRIVPWVRATRVVWAREATLAAGARAGPDVDLLATFTPPPDAPGTDVAAREPVHWELVVTGSIGGRDFVCATPVPVYRREVWRCAAPATG